VQHIVAVQVDASLGNVHGLQPGNHCSDITGLNGDQQVQSGIGCQTLGSQGDVPLTLYPV
jgi:hypothetical protein